MNVIIVNKFHEIFKIFIEQFKYNSLIYDGYNKIGCSSNIFQPILLYFFFLFC